MADIKRLPSVERMISDVSEKDIRVRVVGTVIDKKDELLIIDDGTGKIKANFFEPVKTELNQLVRVIGKVIPRDGGVEIQGEILQDMSGLDFGLMKRVGEAGSYV